jgi:hypothetical protein
MCKREVQLALPKLRSRTLIYVRALSYSWQQLFIWDVTPRSLVDGYRCRVFDMGTDIQANLRRIPIKGRNSLTSLGTTGFSRFTLPLEVSYIKGRILAMLNCSYTQLFTLHTTTSCFCQSLFGAADSTWLQEQHPYMEISWCVVRNCGDICVIDMWLF